MHSEDRSNFQKAKNRVFVIRSFLLPSTFSVHDLATNLARKNIERLKWVLINFGTEEMLKAIAAPAPFGYQVSKCIFVAPLLTVIDYCLAWALYMFLPFFLPVIGGYYWKTYRGYGYLSKYERPHDVILWHVRWHFGPGGIQYPCNASRSPRVHARMPKSIPREYFLVKQYLSGRVKRLTGIYCQQYSWLSQQVLLTENNLEAHERLRGCSYRKYTWVHWGIPGVLMSVKFLKPRLRNERAPDFSATRSMLRARSTRKAWRCYCLWIFPVNA